MDFYDVLGISMDADEASIRNAYRILARRYHPDSGAGSSSEKFRQVAEAYETLGNPGRRHSYDLSFQQIPHFAARFAEPVEPLLKRPEFIYQENPEVFGRVKWPRLTKTKGEQG
jgi:DnaJ-class molecular chaperone